MRIAASPTAPSLSAADAVLLCVQVERRGVREVWLSEVAGPEAFSLAGGIASATQYMEIGVAVVAAANRSVALHAMGAVTISQLLEGRAFHLGIGASSQLIVESWHDRTFDPPRSRVRDMVDGVKQAIGGARSVTTDTAQMSGFRLAGPAVGVCDVYVGALGPGMLRTSGEVGDGVCLNLMPANVVAKQIALSRKGAALTGRDLPDSFGVMARFHTVVTDDLDEGRDLIRRAFGPYFAQPVYNRFLAWCGFEEAASKVAEGFAAGDRGAVAAALTDEVVDAVSLVGPMGAIRDRLVEFSEAGVTVGAINLLTGDRKIMVNILAYLAEY
ncbi:MAG: LLM class flavin-dependent oxidoreductase [Acidobacteria bacterium]|nr:LLM class flavin-dependent oxidoreductase [Acidobacteriota bacterium]